MLAVCTSLAVAVIASVHLASVWLRRLRFMPRSRLLSVAGGMAVAFVFVALLPSVARAQLNLAGEAALGERPAGRVLFFATLVGLLASFTVARSVRAGIGIRPGLRRRLLWLNVASNALLEITIGYLIVVGHRTAGQLALFTIAMVLRALITDRGMYEAHRHDFDRYGRPVLLVAAPVGWLLGVVGELPPAAVAAVRAGGVVLHVLQEELPEDRESRYPAFLLGALGYATLLLLL